LHTVLVLVLCAVCASAGDANQAFAVFQKAKAAEQQLAAAAAAAAAAAGADASRQQSAARAAPKMDGQVYGALIAACAQAIRLRSSDLREQLVILERAFQVRAWRIVYVAAGRQVHIMYLHCGKPGRHQHSMQGGRRLQQLHSSNVILSAKGAAVTAGQTLCLCIKCLGNNQQEPDETVHAIHVAPSE
jgi:hypothetical protein